MDTHVFPEGVKVQRFCVAFVGELGYGMNLSDPLLWIGMVGMLSSDNNIPE